MVFRIVLAFLAAYSFWQPTAVSADEGITMSARAGFEGLARLGTWLPVEVTLANRGPNFTGDLDVRVDSDDGGRTSYDAPPTSHSVTVSLPRFAQKRFVLEVYVPGVTHRVTARLLSDDGVTIEQDVPLEMVPSGELFCGLLARNPAALDFIPSVGLNARQRNARLAHLDVSDIPSRTAALNALDCLIISNIGTSSLSKDQAKALQAWVASGALLIVAGGQNWQTTMAGLPPELLPVRATGTTQVARLDSLASFIGTPFVKSGPWLASQAELRGGNVVVQEGDLPLLVAGRVGAGSVIYLALDPASEPLVGWTGSERLWRNLLSNATALAPAVSAARLSGDWGRVPRQALGDLSGGKARGAEDMLLMMLAYFALIVPGSYFALSKVRRPELGIWTSTGLAAVAGIAGLAIALSNQQSELVGNKISILRSWDISSPAYVRSYVALLSNRQVDAEIQLPPDTLARSLYYPTLSTGEIGAASMAAEQWLLRVREGQAPGVPLGSMAPGDLATFSSDGQAMPAPMAMDLTVAGRHIGGTIANRGDHELRDIALVVGQQVQRLGTLRPGETAMVDLELRGSSTIGYLDPSDVVDQLLPPDNTDSSAHDVLDAALASGYSSSARLAVGPTTVFAWLSSSPMGTKAENAEVDTSDLTLLVVAAPLRFAPGELRVPPELIERRPMSVTQLSKARHNALTIAAGDTVATEYVLPLQKGQLDLGYLAVDFAAGLKTGEVVPARAALGSVQLFDWRHGDWAELPITIGQNVVPEASRFISPLGLVRVRYSYRPPAEANMDQIDITKFDIEVGGVAK